MKNTLTKQYQKLSEAYGALAAHHTAQETNGNGHAKAVKAPAAPKAKKADPLAPPVCARESCIALATIKNMGSGKVYCAAHRTRGTFVDL